MLRVLFAAIFFAVPVHALAQTVAPQGCHKHVGPNATFAFGYRCNSITEFQNSLNELLKRSRYGNRVSVSDIKISPTAQHIEHGIIIFRRTGNAKTGVWGAPECSFDSQGTSPTQLEAVVAYTCRGPNHFSLRLDDFLQLHRASLELIEIYPLPTSSFYANVVVRYK